MGAEVDGSMAQFFEYIFSDGFGFKSCVIARYWDDHQLIDYE
jgi:hypothetical protein